MNPTKIATTQNYRILPVTRNYKYQSPFFENKSEQI